jgi:beta-lactamase superfamily II metal-dependent hydrolase
MKKATLTAITASLLFCMNSFFAKSQQKEETLPAWQAGFLDIHFIETGSGNANFMVFPDGTTMLVDAGALNKKIFDKKHFPLKVTPVLPNDSKRAGQWIISYIKQVMPNNRKPQIDYALITHFHVDHYGEIDKKNPLAANKDYQLSGITDVGDGIPIGKLLDRGFNYPLDLGSYYKNNLTFSNYLKFIDSQTKNGLKHEELQPGSSKQIALLFAAKKYPNFSVRNIKTNNNVWSGEGETSYKCFPDSALTGVDFNENPLSTALKVNYGNFSFYTGGDNTGYEGAMFPGRKNVESAIARAVGKVTLMSLNHHGNWDANNDAFMKALSPSIVVQQSWCSDQPGQELAFRLVQKNSTGDSIHVFNTNMQAETQSYLGPWITKAFKSLRGHVVIRVSDAGSTYSVYVLNENKEKLQVLKTFGPYATK